MPVPVPVPVASRRPVRLAAVALLTALLSGLLPAAPAVAASALILTPDRDAVVGARVQVDVRAGEATRVDVLVDGQVRGSDDTPAPFPGRDGQPDSFYQLYSVVLDLSGLSGRHTIGAVAVGSDGTQDSDERSVVVDTVAPTLTLTGPLSATGGTTIATASEPLLAPVEGAAVLRDSAGRRLPVSTFCHTSASPDSGGAGCQGTSSTRYLGVRLESGLPVVGERYVLELTGVTDAAGNRPARADYPVRAQTRLSDEGGVTQRWARIGNTRATGGSYLQSRDAGSGLVVLTGQSSLVVQYVRGPGLGVLEISGGRTTRRVDLYSPTVQYGGSLVYDFGCGTSCFLQFAQLQVTGGRNPRSTGTAVAVDGVLSRDATGKTSPAAVLEAWRRVATSGATGSAVRESSTPGSAVEMRFRSTRVAWTTVVGPDQGIADVVVDGRRIARVDGYAPTRRLVTRTFDVADGVHLLRIVPTGSRRSGASGAGVSVEALAVR